MSKESAVEIEGLQSSLTANRPLPPQTESPGSGTKARDEIEVVSLTGKATGPRSVAGKQRSSRNSTKHGIFSGPLLLGEENPELYRRLLLGLDESLHPEGKLELLLVEKLASIVWRQRRLLQAESAEIKKNLQLVEDDMCDFNSEIDEMQARARADKQGAELDKEIQRLESLRKKPATKQSSCVEILSCKVPRAPELDRLLRYEASLERTFDRTLSQLERLQRMRLGQPVLPAIKLDVSSG